MNNVIKAIREMTDSQVDLVFHASGLERSKTIYREYSCTYIDSPVETGLVKMGVMVGPQHNFKNAWGTDREAGYFYLTDFGKQIALTIKKGQTAHRSKLLKEKR